MSFAARHEQPVSPALSVTWDQVRAFRLDRQGLRARGPRSRLPALLSRMGGAQAQLASAAELSAWARVEGLRPGDIASALWGSRRVAKAWCMRRTLHLVASHDLAVFVRGSARRAEKEIRWTLRHSVTQGTLDRILDAATSALGSPVTRTALAEHVCRSLGLPMRWEAAGGWGSPRKVPCVAVGGRYLPAGYLLHLLGAREVVCSGPDDGNEATFVRADAWLPGWRDVGAERAEEELLRRFLRSFGPATPRDFVAWTQMTGADAERIWERIGGELAPVDVEGARAWLLRRDLTDLERPAVAGPSVRLLPYFDSYLLGHADRAPLVEPGHHPKVYRPQGWVAPVLLVDGRVRGVWDLRRAHGACSVRIVPFGALGKEPRKELSAEAVALGGFLGNPRTEVEIARPAGPAPVPRQAARTVSRRSAGSSSR